MLKIYTWLKERPEKKRKIIEQIVNNVCRKSKISKEEITRAMQMESKVDTIFDENQKVQLEIKEEERAKKYNYKAKNLKETTETYLGECVAIAKIAREDQKRLDLDFSEWCDYIKELTNE